MQHVCSTAARLAVGPRSERAVSSRTGAVRRRARLRRRPPCYRDLFALHERPHADASSRRPAKGKPTRVRLFVDPASEPHAMSYQIDLSGRVAFVTGASSGLGEQFARTLSHAGAGVVMAARRTDLLK